MTNIDSATTMSLGNRHLSQKTHLFLQDSTMQTISWDDFIQVELRLGTVIKAEPFPEAQKPAIKVWVDFGSELGIKKSSAQIADLYDPQALIGRRVIGVVNFPPKQIGPFLSEFLLTGFANEKGQIVLASVDASPAPIPDGAKLL